MNPKITYSDEPIGDPEVIPDFPPSFARPEKPPATAGYPIALLADLFAGLPTLGEDVDAFLADLPGREPVQPDAGARGEKPRHG